MSLASILDYRVMAHIVQGLYPLLIFRRLKVDIFTVF